MANSITTHTTFTTKTVISSAAMNTNFINVISGAPFWQKYTVDFSDVNTTTASHTATVYSLDPKEHILSYTVKHNTAFVGGSISDVKVSLGIAGDNTKHAYDFDVNQAVGDTVFNQTDLNLIESFANTTTIYAKFSTTGANLDSLTAGSVDIWVLKNLLP